MRFVMNFLFREPRYHPIMTVDAMPLILDGHHPFFANVNESTDDKARRCVPSIQIIRTTPSACRCRVGLSNRFVESPCRKSCALKNPSALPRRQREMLRMVFVMGQGESEESQQRFQRQRTTLDRGKTSSVAPAGQDTGVGMPEAGRTHVGAKQRVQR